MYRKPANKYGNCKTAGYDSRKEARRGAELEVMEKAGLIQNLRRQVKYELIPRQIGECGTDLKGRPVRVLLEHPVRYVADFVYEMAGQTIVEDAKGMRTREYVIKRKLMLYVHGIKIKEV